MSFGRVHTTPPSSHYFPRVGQTSGYRHYPGVAVPLHKDTVEHTGCNGEPRVKQQKKFRHSFKERMDDWFSKTSSLSIDPLSRKVFILQYSNKNLKQNFYSLHWSANIGVKGGRSHPSPTESPDVQTPSSSVH